MRKLINILIIGFIVISTLINLYYINNLDRLIKERIEVLDIEPELIIVDSLIYDTMYLTKTEVVRLPIVNTDTVKQTDTIVTVDSVLVELPIEVKHFSDTLVNTAISFDMQGHQCKIKDLYVHNFLNAPTQKKAVNKWYNNFGIGVGLGVSYIERFRVVPNIGIYYKLM